MRLWTSACATTAIGRARAGALAFLLEFSFHHIEMDNKTCRSSLYASGSSYLDGIVEYDFFYEPWACRSPAASRPIAMTASEIRSRAATAPRPTRLPSNTAFVRTAASWAAITALAAQTRIELQPGEETRLIFMLGVGSHADGLHHAG